MKNFMKIKKNYGKQYVGGKINAVLLKLKIPHIHKTVINNY